MAWFNKRTIGNSEAWSRVVTHVTEGKQLGYWCSVSVGRLGRAWETNNLFSPDETGFF